MDSDERNEMPRTYNIFEVYDPREPIAAISADSEIDALAEFSVSQGFTDPRESEDGRDFFSQQFDGTTTMVFTNTELVAVPA